MFRFVWMSLVVVVALGWLPEMGLAQTGYYQRIPTVSPRRWQFGVSVNNTQSGCVVKRVVPGTPAAKLGLQKGDTIVRVSGTPVGYVRGRLYDLSDVIDSRADAYGRVSMSILDINSRQIVRFTVQLRPAWQARPPVVVVPPRPQVPQRNPTVDIIKGWFQAYLGRDVRARDIRGWVNAVERGDMKLADVKVGILSSSEYYDRCRNNPGTWITTMFIQVVGRRPTSNEVTVWAPRLYTVYRGDRGRLTKAFLRNYGKY
ncbi:MAG: PDZ domain-containing protein [Gemmataceae bacterium]